MNNGIKNILDGNRNGIKVPGLERDGNGGNEVGSEEVISSFDFSKFGGDSGAFEIQKYLYETGIQNAFDEYQKNIANLDSSKQKEIEDAHYIRELSRKYLGEYASNVGVGDVSGELLNIYGNYQNNLNTINQHYKSLEMGLETSYQDKKQGFEMGLVESQYQNYLVEQEKLALEEEQNKISKLAELQHDLITGNLPEGMSERDFLNANRELIGEVAYWQEMTRLSLVDQSKAVSDILSNATSYATQEEFDAYVDEELASGKITQAQATELKSRYVVEQNTNFNRINNSFNGHDISFYNPENMNIKENGRVYSSANGENILAETNNVVYPDNNTYDNIKQTIVEVDENGNERFTIGYDTVFGHLGKSYVMDTIDGETVFIELAVSKNPNKLTGGQTIKPSEDVILNDMYEKVNEELKGKNGYLGKGGPAYVYDEESKSYTSHVNFEAFDVGDEKGTFVIDGIEYEITKNKSIGNNTKKTEIKGNFNSDGTWKSGTSNEFGMKDVMNVFLDVYFNGDKNAMYNYVNDSRTGLFQGGNWFNSSQNKINKENAMVVEWNGNYYTINDGELWRLERK